MILKNFIFNINMRYIPELQALCAKNIAKHCRSMTKKDRYYFLRKIPKHLKEYVNCFPTDFILWCGHEQILNLKIIQHYIRYSKDQKYIRNSYISDCESGITRRRIIFRKCSNYYCENDFLDKIIHDSSYVYWNLCSECKKYRVYHHILMKLHRQIEDFVFV